MMDSQLRVVILSDAIQGRNGVGTYYQDLVSHLRGRLHHVDLIAPDLDNPPAHQSFSVAIPGDKTQRLFFPRFKHLPKLLADADPDVIVIPTLGPYSLMALWHARKMRAKVCIAHHTDFEKLAELYWHPAISRTCNWLLHRISVAFLRAGKIVATNNQDAADSARRLGIKNVRLVGTPVSRMLLDTPTTPVSDQLESVLYLGRLAPEKNIEAVVEAAEKLPSIRFEVAGDGPLRHFVEQRSQAIENLHYWGWLPREKVMDVLDDVDMLVLPSSVESFGTVAMEAMCRRRHVLVSPHCGIRDWPTLAENLFFMKEDELLSDSIQRVAALDITSRERLVNRGQHAARTINEQAVEDWLSIFSDLAQSGRHVSRVPVRRAS